MKRFFKAFVLLMGLAQAGAAQNLLVNGDFEADNVPNYGDNVGVTPTGWLRAQEHPSGPAYLYRQLSLVKTDGPGGQTLSIYHSPLGQANTWAFPEADVTFGGASVDAHYVRLNGKEGRWSVLGQRFRAPYTGCIAFGGSVAAPYQTQQQFRLARVNENALNNAIAANSYSVNDSTSFNWQSDVTYAYATRSSNDWEQALGHMAVASNTLYAFTYIARVNHLMDDAFAYYVDNSNCPSLPPDTPNPPNVATSDSSGSSAPDLAPEDVLLNKSCDPIGPSSLPGVQGQDLICHLTVTVPQVPFAGELTIIDNPVPPIPPNFSIYSATIASGNGSCSGNRCTIEGNNFDPSGTEVMDVHITLGDNSGTDYNVTNCVSGIYSAEIGNPTGVTPNLTPQCINASWQAPNIPAITPTDVTLVKTCQPPEPYTNNGVLGQLWACQVDVHTAVTPFSGDIVLHDVFTDTALVNGETLQSESVSGNGSCSQGDCQISGASFDTSGTESFNFDVFVQATDTAGVYPLENCATGEIDDGSGTPVPLTQDCTAAQWNPRSEVVKTCDPIPEGSVAPYTMNCQIDVTASDLVGGTFVNVIDAFVARPPSIATVTPTFMNVTSNENWDCTDASLNQPSSIGFCELPAEDLMAAGGNSTLDISFPFDVDQAPTQVANCRFTDITPGSVIDSLHGTRSAMRNPLPNGDVQSDGWPQMPDGCVYVDVPGSQLETKVDPKITKKCDQPTLTTHNGTPGYLWQCEAEVNVSPSPFDGDVSFADDGSGISLGTSTFVSVSEPSSICQGLGTDTLDCTFPGATFTSPHLVQYSLFTPYVPTDEEIKWENCIRGEAVTPAGTFPTEPMCVGRFIKPGQVPDLSPAKDVKLEKVCEEAGHETTHDGEAGLAWNCQIVVTAEPAPFAGSFTFTEDASAITGAAGQIVAIDQPQPGNWACSPSVPAQSTDCTIAGANFDSSGTETVGFTLFAPNTDKPIDWKNCVSGTYTSGDGAEPHEIKGNCQGISWKPVETPTPPEFSLKKNCRGPFAQGDAQQYSCTIDVTQTGGDPITQPLTLNELFSSTTTGQPASQFLIALQGTPGWACNVPTASCTIQPADFNNNQGHQIAGIFLIPNGTLAEQDFENCAALDMGDTSVATAACVTIDEQETSTPEFDVTKTCKALGAPQVFSPTLWFQQMQCTITVTSNGVPFNDTLWLDENMLYGPNDGSQSITSISSVDPWQCTSPPFGPPPANQPVCGIQGSQFPNNTSTLDVTLNLFGASADLFGAQNCAALSLGKEPSSDPQDVVAEDCAELAPAPSPEPALDIDKTCAPAVHNSDGLWEVNCEVTVTVGGYTPGQGPGASGYIDVIDELVPNGVQVPVNSLMPLDTPDYGCCWGPFTGTPACYNNARLNAAKLVSVGGSYTLPYTATFSGPGGTPLDGQQTMNCVHAVWPQENLSAPTGPLGTERLCVPIEFPLVASSTGSFDEIGGPGKAEPDVAGPAVIDGPLAQTGGLVDSAVPVPSYEVTKSCDPLVFTAGAQVAQARCDIEINAQNQLPGQIVKLTDGLSLPNGSNTVPFQGAFMNVVSPGLSWACNSSPSPDASGVCYEDSSNLAAQGGTVIATWTAEILRDDVSQHRGLQNCAHLQIGSGPTVSSCAPFEIAYQKAPKPAPEPSPMRAPKLKVRKIQTSDCVPDRTTQRYTCGFRIAVSNEGTAPFNGPLVVTDTFGSPWAQAIHQTSQGGWFCAQPVGGAVSCEHSGLSLPQGAFTYIDLDMEVQGLVNGGSWENCAVAGLSDDRAQRVAAVQQALNARGFNAGPVDGIPGRQTYSALADLQRSLGLPVSRSFDDALFAALGLPLAKPGQKACVLAQLPPMPKPPLQCDRSTTVQDGESCQCRYSNMTPLNATACQCKRGYALVAGEGCVKQLVQPEPAAPLLQEKPNCDKRSTSLRGDRCVCIDQRNAVQTSETTCGCKNGGPMINGRCLPIQINPKPNGDGRDNPAGSEGGDGRQCILRFNDICLKWR